MLPRPNPQRQQMAFDLFAAGSPGQSCAQLSCPCWPRPCMGSWDPLGLTAEEPSFPGSKLGWGLCEGPEPLEPAVWLKSNAGLVEGALEAGPRAGTVPHGRVGWGPSIQGQCWGEGWGAGGGFVEGQGSTPSHSPWVSRLPISCVGPTGRETLRVSQMRRESPTRPPATSGQREASHRSGQRPPLQTPSSKALPASGPGSSCHLPNPPLQVDDP